MITLVPWNGGDPPTLHPGRCVNRRHAGTQCTRCVQACPVDAISVLGTAPELDPALCVRCGLCLQACPTDAFTPTLDYEKRLRETVAQLLLEPTALVCGAHPEPAKTAATVTQIVQHRRCLGALSVADLLELSAGGQRPLWIDDHHCHECVIGAAQTTLHQTIRAARTLLHAAGRAPAILLHSERPPAAERRTERRPLFDGALPAVSRRQLLSLLRPSRSDNNAAPPVEDWLQRGAAVSLRLPQQAPASRQRLLAALSAQGHHEAGVFATDHTSFGEVQADGERCSACALCARFCPTGALQFHSQHDAFALTFEPAACVACGVCRAACPEGAVSFGQSVALSAILGGEVNPLVAGKLVRCAGCGLPTAVVAHDPAPRCHVCRQGAGVVTAQRDEAGLMADLLSRLPSSKHESQ